MFSSLINFPFSNGNLYHSYSMGKKNFYIKYFFRKYTLETRYKTRITFDKLYITRSSFEVRLSDSYLFTFFCNFFDTAVRIPNLFYNLYISSTDYIRTYDDTFAFLDCVYNCWERQNGCDGCYRSTVLPLSLYMTALFQLSGFSLPWISYQSVTIGSNTKATRNCEF